MKGSGGGNNNNNNYLYLVFYLQSDDLTIGDNCSFLNNSAILGAGYSIILIIIGVIYFLPDFYVKTLTLSVDICFHNNNGGLGGGIINKK